MPTTSPKLRLPTFPEIIERALEREDYLTHEAVAARLGIHVNTFYQWRAGKRLPSDEVMLALSTMARISPIEGLLLLNIWRTEGRARTTYEKCLRGMPHLQILTMPAHVVPEDEAATA